MHQFPEQEASPSESFEGPKPLTRIDSVDLDNKFFRDNPKDQKEQTTSSATGAHRSLTSYP